MDEDQTIELFRGVEEDRIFAMEEKIKEVESPLLIPRTWEVPKETDRTLCVRLSRDTLERNGNQFLSGVIERAFELYQESVVKKRMALGGTNISPTSPLSSELDLSNVSHMILQVKETIDHDYNILFKVLHTRMGERLFEIIKSGVKYHFFPRGLVTRDDYGNIIRFDIISLDITTNGPKNLGV